MARSSVLRILAAFSAQERTIFSVSRFRSKNSTSCSPATLPVEVRVTMKRPRLRGQILLAREYLKTGVKPDWQPKDKTEELAFVAEHRSEEHTSELQSR